MLVGVLAEGCGREMLYTTAPALAPGDPSNLKYGK